jgi:hypothetical protein
MEIERNKRLTPDQRQDLARKLAEGYAQGTSLAALAEAHGTSAGRVRLILLEAGVQMRARGGNMRGRKG